MAKSHFLREISFPSKHMRFLREKVQNLVIKILLENRVSGGQKAVKSHNSSREP